MCSVRSILHPKNPFNLYLFFRLCIYTFGGIKDKNHVHGDLYASHFLATEQK